MKNIILSIAGLALAINILCGLIISSYSAFNCGVTSGIIILNALLLLLVSEIMLKDGFRISLNVLFPLLALAEFIAGLFSPEKFQDNSVLVLILVALLLEGIILIITNHISKTI